jgi:hypothetical protein
MKPPALPAVVIGLSAVVVAIQDGDACVLTVRPKGPAQPDVPPLRGLPFGSFDPEGDRTFELALRSFVTEQTRFDLGYVEQLYTFGDKGRDAPIADMGEIARASRVISVGYLALAPAAMQTEAPNTEWSAWSRFFPWEDWRCGRPPALDPIETALRRWSAAAPGVEGVLERYELLYEAGLAPEAVRDRGEGPFPLSEPLAAALGEPMISDHRRILATALSRLRGKLKYRPVVFELMADAFTLSTLQRSVEAIAGVLLHKQNFRRALDRSELVEGLGRMDSETGGRPAELFRFRREVLSERPVSGLALPLLRE